MTVFAQNYFHSACAHGNAQPVVLLNFNYSKHVSSTCLLKKTFEKKREAILNKISDYWKVKCRNSVVNLFFSAYRDENGKPWVLPFVLRIENEMLRSPTYNHEYIPFLGTDLFTELAPPIVLGKNSPALKTGRVSVDYLIMYFICSVCTKEWCGFKS